MNATPIPKKASKKVSLFVNTVSIAVQQNWPQVESILGGVSADPKFDSFLKNYRGHSAPATISGSKQDELRGTIGTELASCVHQIFAQSDAIGLANTMSEEEITRALYGVEEFFNLALYYWCGKNDRNFQFRTVVHFCDLEGTGTPVFYAAQKEWFVSFSEHGIRLGSGTDNHLPSCAPLESAFGLQEFTQKNLKNPTHKTLRKLFARLRTLQRETCLLEEEWEHRNSIVAVEHTELREVLRKNPCAENEEALNVNSTEMSKFRDHLAAWALHTFVAVQCWIADISPLCNKHTDILAEIDALDAVVLSGLQKIFLPASVSRHRYSNSVAELFLSWTEERLRLHPDDVATSIIRDTIKLHLNVTSHALECSWFLSKKSFEYTLSCDPSTGIRALCWNLSQLEHKAITALATIAIARKVSPERLPDYWVHVLASIADMPNSFFNQHKATYQKRELNTPLSLQDICNQALEYIRRAHEDKSDESSKNLLLGFFDSNLGDAQ